MSGQPPFGTPEWQRQMSEAMGRVGDAIHETATAFADLAEAMREGDAHDVAEHPDLTYLDLQLEGFYGDVDEELGDR